MSTQTRLEAMYWWNEMSFEEQYFKMVKYKKHVLGYPDRSPTTLTGREVEKLHKEHINEYISPMFPCPFTEQPCDKVESTNMQNLCKGPCSICEHFPLNTTPQCTDNTTQVAIKYAITFTLMNVAIAGLTTYNNIYISNTMFNQY